MLQTQTPTNVMRPNNRTQKNIVRSYEMSFRCRSQTEVQQKCTLLVTEVERILNASPYVDVYLKVLRVKTREEPKGKGRSKIFVTVEFESCSKLEAHCYFSAECGVVPAPDAKTLIGLMTLSGGSLLHRREQAANFKGRTHGEVIFFERFESNTFSDEKMKRCLHISYAATRTSTGSVTDSSFEDPTELRNSANG